MSNKTKSNEIIKVLKLIWNQKKIELICCFILTILIPITIVGITIANNNLKMCEEQLQEIQELQEQIDTRVNTLEQYQYKTEMSNTYYATNDLEIMAIEMKAPEQQKVYTDEEIEMLTSIVQAEVGADYLSDESRIMVTNVILNRVKSDKFPNTIKEVLTEPNQFSTISNYYTNAIPVTDNTRECVNRALAGEDNSLGSLYYYAPQYTYNKAVIKWFENDLTYLFTLDNQRYFK